MADYLGRIGAVLTVNYKLVTIAFEYTQASTVFPFPFRLQIHLFSDSTTAALQARYAAKAAVASLLRAKMDATLVAAALALAAAL